MGNFKQAARFGKNFWKVLQENRIAKNIANRNQQPLLALGSGGPRLPTPIVKKTGTGTFFSPVKRAGTTPTKVNTGSKVYDAEVLAQSPVKYRIPVDGKQDGLSGSNLPALMKTLGVLWGGNMLYNGATKGDDKSMTPFVPTITKDDIVQEPGMSMRDRAFFEDPNYNVPKGTTSTKKPMNSKPGPKKPGPVKGSNNKPRTYTYTTKPKRYATVDPLNLFGQRNGVNPFASSDKPLTNSRFSGGIVPGTGGKKVTTTDVMDLF